MVRFALLLLAGMLCFKSAHAGWLDDLRAKRNAERMAMIKAGKIPPVSLTEKQKAKLPGIGPRSKITWLGVGRQKDGKIFVCHVTAAKGYIGGIQINLFTGTFEGDGSYQSSPARYASKEAVLQDCWRHGFVPPVKIRH